MGKGDNKELGIFNFLSEDLCQIHPFYLFLLLYLLINFFEGIMVLLHLLGNWATGGLILVLSFALLFSPASNAYQLPAMNKPLATGKIMFNRHSLGSSRMNFGKTNNKSPFLLSVAVKSPSSSSAVAELSRALTNGNSDQQQQQDLSNKGWKWSSIFMAGAFAAISIGAFVSVRRSMETKRKLAIENSNRCPYCKGTGTLLCAGCLGSGTNTQDGSCPCSICNGSTVVTCVNCKGSGSMIVA